MKKSRLECISSVITGLAVIQSVTYIGLIVLSVALGYKLIYLINSITIGAAYVLNMAFTVYLCTKGRREDSAFDHWCSYFPVASTTIFGLSATINFKLVRLFRVDFAQANGDAAFNNEFKTFIRPLFIFSTAAFIFQAIPMILTDIFTIVIIRWDYEIVTMAFDNLVLSLVVFVLEIAEFKLSRR